MDFKEKLRAVREKAGMTQQSLADAAGVPLGTIRNIEQGIRTPLLETAAKLAKAMGVSLGVFGDCEFGNSPAVDVKPAKRKKAKSK